MKRMAKNTYPRLSDIDGLTFHQLPVDGGQIVDISYAVDEGYLYTRRWDRSDNSTRVWREEIDETSETEFEPQNGQLPETTGDEEPVYADDLADMMAADRAERELQTQEAATCPAVIV